MGISRDSLHLVGLFPNLLGSKFEVTSDKTWSYNCIAWAATGEQHRWWEPSGMHYWPSGVPLDYSVESYRQVFQSLGYLECPNSDQEIGFEKVVLYALRGQPTHAARQLDDGSWTSKLGDLEDIRHATLEALAGDEFGDVVCILRRPKQP